MKLNTKDIGFIKFNNQVMNWVKFNGVKVWEAIKAVVLSLSGIPPFRFNSVGEDLIDYKIAGNSEQNGIPTPTAPIEIKSVGIKTENGYKIPIKVMSGTNEVITNIYLDEPLRKIGNYADTLDFENKKVIRKIERRNCAELAWYQHASYSYVYVVNSARFATNTGINPISEFFDSTTYSPPDSIRNMTKDYCIKSHATSSALYISDSVHKTDEEFLDFVKDKYINYILKNPEEQPIELPSVATVKGAVVLELETEAQPSNMEIIYRGYE